MLHTRQVTSDSLIQQINVINVIKYVLVTIKQLSNGPLQFDTELLMLHVTI